MNAFLVRNAHVDGIAPICLQAPAPETETMDYLKEAWQLLQYVYASAPDAGALGSASRDHRRGAGVHLGGRGSRGSQGGPHGGPRARPGAAAGSVPRGEAAQRREMVVARLVGRAGPSTVGLRGFLLHR